jgi:hypothetical protein
MKTYLSDTLGEMLSDASSVALYRGNFITTIVSKSCSTKRFHQSIINTSFLKVWASGPAILT